MSSRDECVAIVRQLWPYLDGALPADWERRVVDHLARCVNCRSHFDFEREFLVAVTSAGRSQEMSEDLRGRVLHALALNGFPAH